MRFAVDGWQPDYGSGTEVGALAPSEVETQIDIEVPVAQWAPRIDCGHGRAAVFFVDGVRRVEARVWITEPDGIAAPRFRRLLRRRRRPLRRVRPR